MRPLMGERRDVPADALAMPTRKLMGVTREDAPPVPGAGRRPPAAPGSEPRAPVDTPSAAGADRRQPAPEPARNLPVPARASVPARRPRDPAPSRLRYRLQRLWLTPWVRFAVRVGLPYAIVVALGFALWSNPTIRAEGERLAQEARAAIAARPEFQLTRVDVIGVGPERDIQIRAALDLTLPVSSLDTDVTELRQRAASVAGVRNVRARIAPGGVIEIMAEERVPLLVWRRGETLTLLDAEGAPVRSIARRNRRADLPLIAGEGADKAVPEALALLRRAAPLQTRLRGLVRVGGRRWDLVLDREQVLRLPETGAEAALARAMALHQAEKLFDRDVLVVDLRDGRRPILRLSHYALEHVRAGQGLKGDG